MYENNFHLQAWSCVHMLRNLTVSSPNRNRLFLILVTTVSSGTVDLRFKSNEYLFTIRRCCLTCIRMEIEMTFDSAVTLILVSVQLPSMCVCVIINSVKVVSTVVPELLSISVQVYNVYLTHTHTHNSWHD